MKEVLQERCDLDQDPEVDCDCFGRLFWKMILVGSAVLFLNSCKTLVKQDFDLPDKLRVVEDGYAGLILKVSISSCEECSSQFSSIYRYAHPDQVVPHATSHMISSSGE